MNFGPYPATVESIHDGDTFRLVVDLGFDLAYHADVRLFGCNAAELSTKQGKAALAFLETVLHIGDAVTLLSHGWDKFGGRCDGQVTLADGRDRTEVMVAAGYAAPWDGKGQKPVPATSN